MHSMFLQSLVESTRNPTNYKILATNLTPQGLSMRLSPDDELPDAEPNVMKGTANFQSSYSLKFYCTQGHEGQGMQKNKTNN